MKKSIFIGIIIFACVISFAFVISVLMLDDDTTVESTSKVKELYSKYSTDVDSAINEYMESEEYRNMNEDAQVERIGDLLEFYEQNNIITNLYYDETNLMYTFTYNHGDIKGALGGVKLKQWNPMMN